MDDFSLQSGGGRRGGTCQEGPGLGTAHAGAAAVEHRRGVAQGCVHRPGGPAVHPLHEVPHCVATGRNQRKCRGAGFRFAQNF